MTKTASGTTARRRMAIRGEGPDHLATATNVVGEIGAEHAIGPTETETEIATGIGTETEGRTGWPMEGGGIVKEAGVESGIPEVYPP